MNSPRTSECTGRSLGSGSERAGPRPAPQPGFQVEEEPLCLLLPRSATELQKTQMGSLDECLPRPSIFHCD